MKWLLRRPGFWITLILVAAVLVTLLGACGDPQQATPVACATYVDDLGRWHEEDGEFVDDDPCDLDDQFEDQGGYDLRKRKSPKPSPKPNVRNTRR